MDSSIQSKIVASVMVLASAATAEASLLWSFDPAMRTVGPRESILMTATLENTSDTPVFIDSGPASFTGDFQKIYDWTPILNLFGRTIPANGSLDFDFGLLTPVGGVVEPGTYVSDPAYLFINGSAPIEAQTRFTVQVVPDTDPSTLCLLALACSGPVWLARRARGQG
ncbi:MAG: hypothetical protein IT580_15005 [Verrucomicrobiales bacterium]|nr:hypothetical protein [Verrucomicrobiales bacterium]